MSNEKPGIKWACEPLARNEGVYYGSFEGPAILLRFKSRWEGNNNYQIHWGGTNGDAGIVRASAYDWSHMGEDIQKAVFDAATFFLCGTLASEGFDYLDSVEPEDFGAFMVEKISSSEFQVTDLSTGYTPPPDEMEKLGALILSLLKGNWP